MSGNSYRRHPTKNRPEHAVFYRGTLGVVYLFHFSKPYTHCKHYIGFSERPLGLRLGEHYAGNGAALTRAIHECPNIDMVLTRTWPPQAARLGEVPESLLVDQCVETALKCWGGAHKFCPVCHPNAYSRARYYTQDPSLDPTGQNRFLYVHPRNEVYGPDVLIPLCQNEKDSRLDLCF